MRAWQTKLWRLGATNASLGTATRLITANYTLPTSRPATTQGSSPSSFSFLRVPTRATTAFPSTARRILRSSSGGNSVADAETKEEQADGLLFQHRSRLAQDMSSLLKIDASMVRRPHTSYNIISHTETTREKCDALITSSDRKPLVPRSSAVLSTQSSSPSPSSSLHRVRLELYSTMSPYDKAKSKDQPSYNSSGTTGSSLGQKKAITSTSRATSRPRY